MGEIADAMLEGALCEECGVYMGDACGYRRTCSDCRRPARARKPSRHYNPAKNVWCPHCTSKAFSTEQGLNDHLRDKHGVKPAARGEE